MLELGEMGCAGANRGIRDKAKREQNSMGEKGNEREKGGQA